jgi:hypothetical protein
MSDKPEVAAIEAAYRARVETLFTGLATNLGDQLAEQQSVDRFAKGLNTAKRARRLALDVVGAAAPAAAAASRRRKTARNASA